MVSRREMLAGAGDAVVVVGLAVGFVVLVDLFVSVSRAQATADDR